MAPKNKNYSEKLTKRIPRKRTKMVKYKEKYPFDYKPTIIGFKENFDAKFGFNIFKTDGRLLHVFFPLTGMSPIGHLLKGFFEQTLPKARITFLVTPQSQIMSVAQPVDRALSLEILRNNIKRSLNTNTTDTL